MLATRLSQINSISKNSPASGYSIWNDATDTSRLFTDAGTTAVSTDGQSVYQWNDSSTNSFNLSQATSANRPTWKSPANGRNGYGVVNFSGSQWISLNYTSSLGTAMNFTGDFTVEAYIKFNSLPSNTWAVFSTFGTVNNQRWVFYYDTRSTQGSPGLRFSSVNASNGVNFDLKGGGTSGWSAGTWYHVAVCRSGNNIRLFRDGTQNGSTLTTSTGIVAATSGSYNLGSETNTSFARLNGQIQHALVYNSALYTSSFTPWDS